MDKKIIYLLVGGIVLAILLLGFGGYVLLSEGVAIAQPTAVPSSPAATQIAEVVVVEPTAVASATAVSAPAELPPPQIQALPTHTPPPSPTPSPTPLPTETPIPTETPVPPTATAVPVVVQPTRPPATAVPATAVPTAAPTAVPANTRGLTASFGIEGGPSFGANQEIWFNFTVNNSSGAAVPFSVLGVYPKKGGTYRPEFIQASWGGNPTDAIPTSGLVWRDNIKIGESGSYTLQLAICFDASYQSCKAGGGTWVFLSGDVPVTIN